jgi:uncharacterized membrane protein HdeD (DUF308 family)
MEIVVYFFAAGFLFMSVALMFAYHRSRHYGLFLIGLSYAVGGILAIIAADWWPLAAAFALGWVLRMAGLDPDPERKQKSADSQSQ